MLGGAHSERGDAYRETSGALDQTGRAVHVEESCKQVPNEGEILQAEDAPRYFYSGTS